MISNYDNLVSDIEKEYKVVNLFKYKYTSSWVAIKDLLENCRCNQALGLSPNRSQFFCFEFVYLVFISIKNYIKNIFNREEKVLFIGSGIGLFNYNSKVLDSYFPYKDIVKNEKVIYFLSGDYPKRLYSYRTYLKNNNIIVYSFIIGVLKRLFAKLLIPFYNSNKFDSICKIFNDNGINISSKYLAFEHLRFIFGYIAFNFFLKPYKIKKAYVVSASTNSDIIAVLKNRGIQVIEIQHGVIGKIHRAYNYSIKSELLPTPDIVYVYNEFWKNELIYAGFYSGNQIIVYGRLKYDLLLNDTTRVNGKYIVFTGQGITNDKLINFFIQSNNYLKDKQTKLYYIPHPTEVGKNLDFLIQKMKEYDMIEILSKKEHTTEKYIIDSIAHVSLFSSCHFDAINYKNRTFILDILDNNSMYYYTQSLPKQFVKINRIETIFNTLDND